MPILHHLSLLHKFSILGLMGLLMGALPTFLYVKESLNNIATLRQEVVGTPPLIALNKVVQLLQVHRGLSAGMLSGNEELGARRPGVRDALTKAIHDADVRFATAQMPSAQSTTWAQLKQTWKALEETVGTRSIQLAQSTTQHTQLIASVMLLGQALRHTYGLEIDHSPDTSALIQTSLVDAPMLSEKLGLMRAQGASFLALGNLLPQGKGTLLGLQQRIGELHGETFRNFERAMNSNPRFHQALEEPVKHLKARIDATRQMADKNLIHATELKMPAPDYFNDFTQTIDAVFAVNTIAMDALEEALRLRMAQQERLLMWMALAMMAVMLITVSIGLVFVRSITQPLLYAKKLAQAAAQGNLSGADIAHGTNEVGELIQAQQQMRAKLCPVVSQVRIGSQNVANASAEIAQGNNDLSARTENQASALGQTSAAMEQLSSTVQKNAASARKANELAENACTVAVKGGEVVAQVVRTMHHINTSSQKISDIIGVIDSIAFQTNILALNAAVEAARAGEQGRGFAVVASEVRLLASRSAQAAQEIKTLIQASVERVEQGSLLVDNAGATMTQVVDSIRLVTSIMGEITSASQNQSQGVAQIEQAITHMDESTQQNASLVEQMAAAASALRAQAQDLVNVVAIFQIGHESDSHGPTGCGSQAAHTTHTHTAQTAKERISFDKIYQNKN